MALQEMIREWTEKGPWSLKDSSAGSYKAEVAVFKLPERGVTDTAKTNWLEGELIWQA